MPDWIGDQIAGVGPEATRVFGRNAQIPVIRLGGWVKLTLRIPTMRARTQKS
jgi:hypothetical protein